MVLLELKAAKQIIELLQEETNCAPPITTANTQHRNSSYGLSVPNSDLEKNTSGNWRKFSYIRRKYNKQPVSQQPQPIPTIANRFLLLDSLQLESRSLSFSTFGLENINCGK
jgi:hypothetical protein